MSNNTILFDIASAVPLDIDGYTMDQCNVVTGFNFENMMCHFLEIGCIMSILREIIAIMHRLFDLFLVICSLASSHLHFHSGYVPAVYMY